MSRKTIALLVFVFLSPVIIYFLLPSEESRIRKVFSKGARAVTAENIDDLMTCVSYNYYDEHGLSYLILRRAMENFFRQWSDISIEYDLKELRIQGEKATVGVDVRVVAASGQDVGYVIGDAAAPVVLIVELEKDKTKWVVVSSRGWQRVN